MWANNVRKVIAPIINSELNFAQQIRTTFVLKRRWPPGLHKINGKPKVLRGRHYVYDLVKDTNIEKQPDLNLVLTSYVAGYGKEGDTIAAKPTVAYNQLLLPGLAVYATPENLKKFTTEKKIDIELHSSPFAQRTVNVMSRMTLAVVMNKDVPWTLESWHIRASFRKCGYVVAENAITMPLKSISGPDLSLENKEFYVTVKINNVEEVRVKCRIHHWSTNITERLPYVFEHWKLPSETVFPEDATEGTSENKVD